MGSVVLVEVDESAVGGVSLGFADPVADVGPFFEQYAVEAFYVAVDRPQLSKRGPSPFRSQALLKSLVASSQEPGSSIARKCRTATNPRRLL